MILSLKVSLTALQAGASLQLSLSFCCPFSAIFCMACFIMDFAWLALSPLSFQRPPMSLLPGFCRDYCGAMTSIPSQDIHEYPIFIQGQLQH